MDPILTSVQLRVVGDQSALKSAGRVINASYKHLRYPAVCFGHRHILTGPKAHEAQAARLSRSARSATVKCAYGARCGLPEYVGSRSEPQRRKIRTYEAMKFL